MRRRVASRRRARRAVGQPTRELVAQLEQRAEAALSKKQPEPSLAEQLSRAEMPTSPRRFGPDWLTSVRSMNRMSNRQLRQAIVLSEVLRPPLALRDIQ